MGTNDGRINPVGWVQSPTLAVDYRTIAGLHLETAPKTPPAKRAD